MGKHALIVANYEYHDEFFRKLVAPQQDAEKLEAVLKDPAIGGFEVEPPLVNKPHYEVKQQIQKFLANRASDDLLLLYFSGHGVKDEDGQLYFATPDTQHTELQATAIEANFVNSRMRNCLSRKQVLLLDCCYSGAFAKGMVARAGTEVNTREHFDGRGRVVLTATDSTSYAYEGDEAKGEAQPSLFTRSLVEGLRTGEADHDSDGVIDIDELYEYVLKRVTALTVHQTPRKWALDVEGTIVVANNPQPLRPAELPPRLWEALENPIPEVRLGAVETLDQLLRGKNKSLALAAQYALSTLKDRDDSMKVRQEAAKCLEAYAGTQRPTVIEVKASPTPIVEQPQVPPKQEVSQPSPPPLVQRRRLPHRRRSAAREKRLVLQWRPKWIAMAALVLVLLAGFVIYPLDFTAKLPITAFSLTIIRTPDGFETQIYGINSSGQIVGSFRKGDTSHGFLRSSTGDFTTIDPPGSIFSVAFGINDAGQIVGSFMDAGRKMHGFVRSAEGAFTTIDVPDATNIYAHGINSSGQIVGEFSKGDTNYGFLRSSTGAFATIDPRSASSLFLSTSGINNAGQIVGSFMDTHRKMHGFVLSAKGVFTKIDVPGADSTEADGINGSGEIVGESTAIRRVFGFIPAGSRYFRFIRTATGAFTAFDLPELASGFRLHGINDSGQIVGFGNLGDISGTLALSRPQNDESPCSCPNRCALMVGPRLWGAFSLPAYKRRRDPGGLCEGGLILQLVLGSSARLYTDLPSATHWTF